MFRRIVVTALLSGMLAGFFLSAAQAVRVVPLIHLAETYEAGKALNATQGEAQTGDPIDHDDGHDQGFGEWERTVYTVLSNLLVGIAFAMLLTAGIAVGGGGDGRGGIMWGLAGFAVFALAPALGLPPELPGAAAADLMSRQIWWVATVLLTGGGLAVVIFVRRFPWTLVGVVLIALPHLIGAPHPAEIAGTAPEALAREFVIASLLTNYGFWLVLGGCSGFLFGKFKTV